MLNGISGLASGYGLYQSAIYNNRQVQSPQSAGQTSAVWTAQKAAQPESPVQPVTPVRPVIADEDPAQAAMLRYASDPAEMAVRMRIQFPGSGQTQAQALPGLTGQGAEKTIPGQTGGEAVPGVTAQEGEEVKSAQEVMEEGECQTCKERKYQDGSDDPGVSFKTPTNISPDQAASAVRGHENEHVVREQAKARQENRKVVSQSVTYHTDICPECGKVYVSGGTTRTVTKANPAQESAQQQAQEQSRRVPFSAVA